MNADGLDPEESSRAAAKNEGLHKFDEFGCLYPQF